MNSGLQLIEYLRNTGESTDSQLDKIITFLDEMFVVGKLYEIDNSFKKLMKSNLHNEDLFMAFVVGTYAMRFSLKLRKDFLEWFKKSFSDLPDYEDLSRTLEEMQ